MLFAKPSKEKRIRNEAENRQKANNHRKQQRLLALFRDNGMCAVCYFVEHRTVVADDVHHVYGRAVTSKILTSFREHYTSLLCLCRKHHNQVGAIRKEGSAWFDMIGVLASANQTPINKEFKHVGEERDRPSSADGRVVSDSKGL